MKILLIFNPIYIKFSSCVSIHHHCLAQSQNGLISPWATLDTIVMSYLPPLKWNK